MRLSRFKSSLLISLACCRSAVCRLDEDGRVDAQLSVYSTGLADARSQFDRDALSTHSNSLSDLFSTSLSQSTFTTRIKPSRSLQGDDTPHVVVRAEQTAQQPQCDPNYGELACGNICCSAAEMCMRPGHCVKSGSSPFNSVITPSMSGSSTATATATSTATEPARPTSSFLSTVTEGSGTYTTDFIAPVATGQDGTTILPVVVGGGHGEGKSTGGSGDHLSTGAIAGIVIGSIAGFLLLLLLLGLLTRHCCGSSRGSYAAAAGGGGEGRHHMGCCEWCGIGLLLGALFCCCRRKRDDSTGKPSTTMTTYSYYDSQSATRTSTSSISSSGKWEPMNF